MTTEDLAMWTWYIVGGVACGLTSFLVAGYRSIHTRIKRRLEYAFISALGCVAICYGAGRYFPETFVVQDSLACGILVGLCGISRVLDYLAQKVGLEKKSENY